MLHAPEIQPRHSEPAWAEVTRRLGFDGLFGSFAADAATRDVARRPVHAEVDALKARRFGALRLSQEAGGQGIGLPELFALVRDLATADPNIAHVFRNHFHAVERHLATPREPFSRHILDLAGKGLMFGVALSETTTAAAGGRDQRPAAALQWSAADGRYRLSGTKIYSTGNMYADYLFASAIDSRTGEPVQFFIPTDAPGVGLDDDWDGFGQKLTGSGRTVFDAVPVVADDLFDLPPPKPGELPGYGFTFHQIYLTTVISGIVERILLDAVDLVRARARNYYHALADRPSAEPEIQAVIGRIAAYRAAICAVGDRAIAALDLAWRNAGSASGNELAVAATIAASEAKVVTDEVAATLASLLIDVSSGSGVSIKNALDRHWRNIKVISSHNPRIYKERVLGDFYLNGALPPTGAFF